MFNKSCTLVLMKISGIIETCIYAENLDEVREFYKMLPGLELIAEEQGRHLFFKCGRRMLLIFNPRHTSTEQTDVDGQIVPLHGSRGATHIAFSIQNEDLENWRDFFKENSIPIESEVTWPNGITSLYFRDPAGNSLEIVSPKLWK